MIPKPKEAETGETGPKEAGPEKARPKEAGPEEVKPKEAGHKEEVKKENIELTGEEEIDHGYEGPVNTKEKKNHNETKAKYQAGRDKAFDTEDDGEYLELIGDDAKYLELIGDQGKDQVPQDWLEKLLSNLDWYGEHGRIKLRSNLQAVKGNLESLKKGNQDYRSRDTFLSEWSKNTPFLRCFDLKTLQIRGVTF